MNSEDKVRATYTIKEIIKEDGTRVIRRTCEGFNCFELLGLLSIAKREIIKQIEGIVKPDITERIVIKEPKDGVSENRDTTTHKES